MIIFIYNIFIVKVVLIMNRWNNEFMICIQYLFVLIKWEISFVSSRQQKYKQKNNYVGFFKRIIAVNLKQREFQWVFSGKNIEILIMYGIDFKCWIKRSKGYEKYKFLLMNVY